jgi:hypothetical protein
MNSMNENMPVKKKKKEQEARRTRKQNGEELKTDKLDTIADQLTTIYDGLNKYLKTKNLNYINGTDQIDIMGEQLTTI